MGAPGKPTNDVVIFNFGIEDSQAARAEGRSMRAFNYAPAQAEQFLFAEGWNKYHDRFFTRAYVQEGMDAFWSAVKPEPSRQSPTKLKSSKGPLSSRPETELKS
jgi:hypothetical protein